MPPLALFPAGPLSKSEGKGKNRKQKTQNTAKNALHGITFLCSFQIGACEICSASEFSPDAMTTERTNTLMRCHCFAVIEMDAERERGEWERARTLPRTRGERRRWWQKGETIEHPGRFFNQIITVIRCKANVKRLHEIPMRKNALGIHNCREILYSFALGTDLKRTHYTLVTIYVHFVKTTETIGWNFQGIGILMRNNPSL